MTQKRLPPAERRQQIINGTIRLAKREGLVKVTLLRVAAECEISAPLIYRYFESIQHLISIVIEISVTEQYTGILRDALALRHKTALEMKGIIEAIISTR